MHIGDSIHNLYVNDGAYSEQEMDEWLESLEYNNTQEMDHTTNIGGYYCRFLVYIGLRPSEEPYSYIVAMDLSKYLDNGVTYDTGMEGYILIAGYDGIAENAKLIYSTVSEELPIYGEVEKGWQGVTWVGYDNENEYQITRISEDLKEGIFAWMSWKYNR